MDNSLHEYKELVKPLNDKARKTSRRGNQTLVPHKVKASGETITETNLDAKTDLSLLNMNELRFLDAFRESGWDLDKACGQFGVSLDQGRKTYKKCLWFQKEDEIVKAKAKVPTANYVLAKDLDNVEGVIELSDSDHKSLDRMAKITGSFKTTTDVNVHFNAFLKPELSAEEEKRTREFFDTIATAIPAP